jgi:hypothetical protein
MKHVVIREITGAEHEFRTQERDPVPRAGSRTAVRETLTKLPILHWIVVSVGGIVTLAWVGAWSWLIASWLTRIVHLVI